MRARWWAPGLVSLAVVVMTATGCQSSDGGGDDVSSSTGTAAQQKTSVDDTVALLVKAGVALGARLYPGTGTFLPCDVGTRYEATVQMIGFAFGDDPRSAGETTALRSALDDAGLTVVDGANPGSLVGTSEGLRASVDGPLATRSPRGTSESIRGFDVTTGCVQLSGADQDVADAAGTEDYTDRVPATSVQRN